MAIARFALAWGIFAQFSAAVPQQSFSAAPATTGTAATSCGACYGVADVLGVVFGEAVQVIVTQTVATSTGRNGSTVTFTLPETITTSTVEASITGQFTFESTGPVSTGPVVAGGPGSTVVINGLTFTSPTSYNVFSRYSVTSTISTGGSCSVSSGLAIQTGPFSYIVSAGGPLIAQSAEVRFFQQINQLSCSGAGAIPVTTSIILTTTATVQSTTTVVASSLPPPQPETTPTSSAAASTTTSAASTTTSAASSSSASATVVATVTVATTATTSVAASTVTVTSLSSSVSTRVTPTSISTSPSILPTSASASSSVAPTSPTSPSIIPVPSPSILPIPSLSSATTSSPSSSSQAAPVTTTSAVTTTISIGTTVVLGNMTYPYPTGTGGSGPIITPYPGPGNAAPSWNSQLGQSWLFWGSGLLATLFSALVL